MVKIKVNKIKFSRHVAETVTSWCELLFLHHLQVLLNGLWRRKREFL